MVDIAYDGTFWGVQFDGDIFRWNGSGWTRIAGSLQSIKVGSANHIWGVQSDGDIFKYIGN